MFLSKSNLKSQLNDYLRIKAIKFDFITSSKFIGEFYNLQDVSGLRLFQGMTEVISEFLQKNGIYILLDVVAGSRDHKCDYKTKIMSDELNSYVNSNSTSLRYIYPSPCACWSSICKTKGCYYAKCFAVSHSRVQNDKSNVAFRILTNNEFANQIISQREIKEYYDISKKTQCKDGIVSRINLL